MRIRELSSINEARERLLLRVAAAALLCASLWVAVGRDARAGDDGGDGPPAGSVCTGDPGGFPNGSATGGGSLVSGQLRLSTSGNVHLVNSVARQSEFTVQFDNVGLNSLDGKKFKATVIDGLVICRTPDSTTPPGTPNWTSFRAQGVLEGSSVTHWMLVDIGDWGQGGAGTADSVQILLGTCGTPATCLVYDSDSDFGGLADPNTIATGNYQVR